MLLSSIASIIFQITYKTQNLVKCQGILSTKTQSIRKVDRKIHQTKHLSHQRPKVNEMENDPELLVEKDARAVCMSMVMVYEALLKAEMLEEE